MSRSAKLGIAAVLAVAGVGGITLVAKSGVITERQVAGACPKAARMPGQPILHVQLDSSPSTAGDELRGAYGAAALAVSTKGMDEDAYLVLGAFGRSIAESRIVCETSLRIRGAAPLFKTSRRAKLELMLEQAVARAAAVEATEQGSSIYGALVESVERVRRLGNDDGAPARVVLFTDGDETSDRVHLRLLLGTVGEEEIARRIIGSQPVPDASGIAIELRGVGRLGVGRTIPTVGVRRMQGVWRHICRALAAASCLVTTDL
jgi:hypothetical protein